jgi:hypothetical protein
LLSIAATASPLTVLDPQFETRWSAWQARGAAHDARLQRRMRVAAPLLAVLTAAAVYFLSW